MPQRWLGADTLVFQASFSKLDSSVKTTLRPPTLLLSEPAMMCRRGNEGATTAYSIDAARAALPILLIYEAHRCGKGRMFILDI